MLFFLFMPKIVKVNENVVTLPTKSRRITNIIYIKTLTMNFVEELKWRGMINDIMPGAEEQLNKEMTSG